MGRVLLNALTLLSLLVCLAGILTWGRSYEIGDVVHVTRGLRSVSILSEAGSYRFATSRYAKLYGDSGTWEAYAKRSSAAAAVEGQSRFAWEYEGGASGTWSLYIVLPQWVVPVLFAPLPAVRIARWLRWRRLARHRGFEVEPTTPAASDAACSTS